MSVSLKIIQATPYVVDRWLPDGERQVCEHILALCSDGGLWKYTSPVGAGGRGMWERVPGIPDVGPGSGREHGSCHYV